MKKFVKLLSLVLALLMIVAVFAACGDKENEDETKPNDTVAGTNDGTGDGSGTEGTTKVPDIPVMNWDGKEYRVLGKNSSTYAWAQHFEVWREELPEDVVGKQVWERNQDMLENYGVDVKGYLDEKCNDLAKTALESGEDLYDLILISPEKFNPLATQGYLLDLFTLEHINLNHDAWMPYPNEQLSMGGRLYYTTNKFLIQDKNRYWGMFYNRDMARELNLGYFETMVFDGTWTMDQAIELAKQATFEKDGQPGLDKGDNWGAGSAEYYNFVQLAFGVGFRFTQIGADGYPELIGATDEIMSRLDKLFQFIANRDIYYCSQHFGKVDWKDCADQMFHRGQILLYPTVLSELQTVGSKVSFEFGVLPNPKFDDKQEAYHTIPNLGNGSLLGVPATVVDTEFAGYGLELISEKSVDTSYKAFIETTCKLQKVQDDDAAKCLELIYQGIVYDIAFVSDIGGIGNTFWKNVVSSPTNNWSRIYSRNEGVVKVAIDKVRAAYAELASK